jgi:DNA-binding response OmpR family regulator
LEGETVNLSATEFSLLLFLVKNRGTVFSRDAILDHVWGENYFGDYRIVDTNIKRLREKLGEAASCLQTVRGVGYCLVEE